MTEDQVRLTLYQPLRYQIKASGALDQNWSNWVKGITVVIENEISGMPVTTLSGEFDQAALIGLLRRLYSRGLPLISVACVEQFAK